MVCVSAKIKCLKVSEKVCFPKISLEVDYDKVTVLFPLVSSIE